jgi:O-antigen/teichoic acid export membrane protein
MMIGSGDTIEESPSRAKAASSGEKATASPVRLLWSYIALAAGSFGGQVLGFIGLTVVARKIGPHNLGAYGFANGLSGYFALPLMGGIGLVGVRDVARGISGRSRIIADVGVPLFLNAALAYALLFFLAPVFSADSLTQTLLRLLGLNLIIAALSPDWVIQGTQHMRVLSLFRFSGQVVYLLVLLSMIVPGSAGTVTYAVCNLIGAATTAVLGIVYVVRSLRFRWERRRMNIRAAARRMMLRVRKSTPAGLGLTMVSIYYSCDVILLGFLRGNYAVGEYTAADKIPAALAAFAALWVTVFYPHAASLFRSDPEKLRRQTGEFATLSLLIALPCTGLGFLLGRNILTAVFGAKFAPGSVAFALLLCTTGILFVNANLTQLLLACDDEKAYAWSVAAGVAINVVLNLLLIPLWGFDGSALATVAAEVCVIAVAIPRLNRRVGRITLRWSRLIRAAPALVFMGLVLGALRSVAPWWLALFVSGAVYLALLGLTRSVTLREVGQLFGSSG